MIRKTVTLVFCDVADSTPLGERLDPEALRGVWSTYHETARAVLERHGAESIVLVHHRDPEDRKHGVPDELLDRRAVPLEHRAGGLVIGRPDPT